MNKLRKCVSCGEYKKRREMIKITKDYSSGNVVAEPNSRTFGRSVYLCYNKSCIETALKKNKLDKILKTKISEELKGQLLNELRNG